MQPAERSSTQSLESRSSGVERSFTPGPESRRYVAVSHETEPCSSGGRPRMHPDRYDGQSSWLDYKKHFQVVAKINGWSKSQMSYYLAASLKGIARAMLGTYSEEQIADYDLLVRGLGARFSPENMSEMYRSQLKVRTRGPKETIPELGQVILRLTTQTYTSLPHEAQDRLARDHFIDALDDSDMRLQVQLGAPSTLNDAVYLALKIETFKESERLRGPVKSSTGFNSCGNSRQNFSGGQGYSPQNNRDFRYPPQNSSNPQSGQNSPPENQGNESRPEC